jgi:Fur family transcriptional regulator, ferric uptake regulator
MERKTRQHQAIHDAIVAAHRPLLAQEVLALASEAVPRLSLATVYRNIKALQDEGSIKAVVLPGQNPRYELASRSHHHYFQCRQCERVFDLEACPGNLERLAPSGFMVEDHEIILYGKCDDCAADQGQSHS